MSRPEPEAEPTRGSVTRPAIALDSAALAAIVVLSAMPYLFQLGFYSDDWGLLAGFREAERSGSLAGLVIDNFAARPVQGAYLAGLFSLVGLAPLGYHVVNLAVIAGSAVLLYLLLIRLDLGRGTSFATVLLFALLPQLSTVRVWYAAFQVPLSLALMLTSLHCQLSFAGRRGAAAFAGALVFALLSVGAYEIFAPFIVAFAAVLMVREARASRSPRLAVRGAVGVAVLAGVAIVAIVAKAVSSGRAGPLSDPDRYLMGLHQLVRLDYDYRVDSSLNIVAMLQTHFWSPVRGWWDGAIALIGGGSALLVAAIAVVIAAVAWWRVQSAGAERDRHNALRLLIFGCAAFVLGHAVFLVVPSINFTPTGMSNRTHVAAAIGVAMIFAALFRLVADRLAGGRAILAFTAMVSTVALLAFVRLSEIESYWARTPEMQEEVLRSARADLKDVPAGSTIILDRVCPYLWPRNRVRD